MAKKAAKKKKTSKNQKYMTQSQFLYRKGHNCPVCGSDDLMCNGLEQDYDNGCMFQDMNCETCGSMWTETYSITGYIDLEEAEQDDFDPNTEDGES